VRHSIILQKKYSNTIIKISKKRKLKEIFKTLLLMNFKRIKVIKYKENVENFANDEFQEKKVIKHRSKGQI